MINKIDLHFHSNASDGLLNPKKLLDLAKINSIDVLSLTDHDSVNNNNEMEKLCIKENIKFIPGIEVSTKYNGESIHILAYFKNNSYKNKEFLDKLNEFRENRISRAKEIIRRLKEFYNIEISYEDLKKEENMSIGRPHLAKLIKDKYNISFDEIFKTVLNDNSKAYIPSSNLTIEEAFDLLNLTDCIKIIAHPGQYNTSIEELLKFDFDGIECFYSMHTMDEISKYLKIAKENNLFVTCGSDYHGILNDSKHGSLGSMFFKEEYLDSFLKEFNIC